MAAYLPKVNLLFGMGRYGDAETELRAALAEDPDDALAHAMLGVALSRTRRLREALDESESAIGLDPTNSYVFYARGLVLIQANRFREALRPVREAIRLSGNNPEYLYVLAWLLSDALCWSESLVTVDRGVAIAPRHIASLELRGRVLQGLGRPDDAKQAFDAALAADPQNATAHHSRGKLLLAGADAAAANHLLEARRLDPLTKNDTNNIALAVGRQMAPFRWVAPLVPRWNLWRPQLTWALFMTLLLVDFGLSRGSDEHLNANFPLATLVSCKSQAIFLAVAVNLLFLPFSFDTLVSAVAQLLDTPPRRQRSFGRAFQVAGRASAIALLTASMLLVHLCVTTLAMLPRVIAIVFGCGACTRFALDFCSRCTERRVTSTFFALYAGLLALSWFVPALLFDEPADRSLMSIAVFAVPAYFSDNVARWIRRWER
jgi:tetratricopeptide (TPR) repeat protein